MKHILALILSLAFALQAGAQTKGAESLTSSSLLASMTPAALPTGATVVQPIAYGAAYTAYPNRLLRQVQYSLPGTNRVYEFQKSTDGGVTWKHSQHSWVWPDSYIMPSDPRISGVAYPFYGRSWTREERLNSPTLFQRCVDWTDVPNRPSPSTWTR